MTQPTGSTPSPDDRLLKVADAAERLSVGDDWVYERINRGEIPVVELGDTRKNQRILESDLRAFIDARRYGRTKDRTSSGPVPDRERQPPATR